MSHVVKSSNDFPWINRISLKLRHLQVAVIWEAAAIFVFYVVLGLTYDSTKVLAEDFWGYFKHNYTTKKQFVSHRKILSPPFFESAYLRLILYFLHL
jgi:hypothetical protein